MFGPFSFCVWMKQPSKFTLIHAYGGKQALVYDVRLTPDCGLGIRLPEVAVRQGVGGLIWAWFYETPYLCPVSSSLKFNVAQLPNLRKILKCIPIINSSTGRLSAADQAMLGNQPTYAKQPTCTCAIHSNSIVVKPQPLLCLTQRGRGNIGSFLRNTGQVLPGRFQQGANQRAHRQMSSSMHYLKRYQVTIKSNFL